MMIRGFLAAVLVCVAAGCSSNAPTTRPASMAERQDQAMKDPMNYSPHVNPNVSGGGIGDFDKDAFKRDLDHVLNP